MAHISRMTGEAQRPEEANDEEKAREPGGWAEGSRACLDEGPVGSTLSAASVRAHCSGGWWCRPVMLATGSEEDCEFSAP